MKVFVRLIITALILASIGFGVYYYFNRPDSAVDTYNAIGVMEDEAYYTNFDSELDLIMQNYDSQAATINYYRIVTTALDNNFNYYKTFLLYIENATADAQSNLIEQMQAYSNTVQITYQLVAYFNDNTNLTSNEKEGMYQNFLTAYIVQVNEYIDLVKNLQTYVIDYAFNSVKPQNLKATLLQVQLDYGEVLNVPENPSSLINELNSIILKYGSFNNESQSEDASALNFIYSYNNLEDKASYFASLDKLSYISNFLVADQQTYATTIYNFLNSLSYN